MQSPCHQYDYFPFWFFSGAEDHYAHVWHRQAGGKVATLKGHTNVVNCVTFNPRDQQMLVSASDDHTIRVWKSRQLAKVTEENWQEQEELSAESSGSINTLRTPLPSTPVEYSKEIL